MKQIPSWGCSWVLQQSRSHPQECILFANFTWSQENIWCHRVFFSSCFSVYASTESAVSVLLPEGLCVSWIFNQGGSEEEWEGNLLVSLGSQWYCILSDSSNVHILKKKMLEIQRECVNGSPRVMQETLLIFLAYHKDQRMTCVQCLHGKKTLVCKRLLNCSVNV